MSGTKAAGRIAVDDQSVSASPADVRPADQVLEVDDADDVVLVLPDDRDAGEAAAQRQGQRLPDRLVPLDEDQVGARHHHLAHEGVAELEDGVHHLALVVLDQRLLLGQVDQRAQLRLGGERALAEALARGERVAEQDQQLRQRAQDPGQRHQDVAAAVARVFSVLAADGARRDADADVADQRPSRRSRRQRRQVSRRTRQARRR